MKTTDDGNVVKSAPPSPAGGSDALTDFAKFKVWAEQHLGQGYPLDTEDGTFTNPVTRWAFKGFCAGLDLATPPQSSGQTDLSAAIMALPRFDTSSEEFSFQGERRTATEFGPADDGEYILRADALALLASQPSAPQATTAAQQNMELVIARLEQIIEAAETADCDLMEELAKEALPCARAVLAHIGTPQASQDAVDEIDLIDGSGWLKREAKTTGENGWLMFGNRNDLIRALSYYEVRLVDSALAATMPSAAPGGFVLAPEYPTQAMRDAGNRKLDQLKTEPGMAIADRAFYAYSAMLAAAPSPLGDAT